MVHTIFTYKIKSMEDYLSHIEKYKGTHLFRGQANCLWPITPSLFRNDLAQEPNILQSNIKELSGNIVSEIFKLQHYGKPTRLIDLTISIYSALFFAVNSNFDDDGIIYVIKPKEIINCKNIQLNEFCKLLFKYNLTENCPKELLSFAITNHIINNDINYMFSNERAKLQGGTSLMVGLSIINGELSREKTVDIDNITIEKIIIPKEIKKSLLKILINLGYDTNILYIQKDKLNACKDFHTSEISFNIEKRNCFYKIIGKYLINTMTPDIDILIKKIDNMYLQYFNKYGKDSRIWLYFCYDNNDEVSSNWICRTCWKENEPYKIIWTKDYIEKRIRKFNEEFSFAEICNELLPIIKESIDILQLLVKASKYNIEEIRKVIDKKHELASKLFLKSTDIHFCAVEKEQFPQDAVAFISSVEQIYSEMNQYFGQKQSDNFLFYWSQELIAKALKHQKKLLETCASFNVCIF